MNFNIFQRKKSSEYSALQLMMEPSWSRRDYASFAEEGYIKTCLMVRCNHKQCSKLAASMFEHLFQSVLRK